ncbi:MAG: toll/interleukin-1 receptor domain-containing protein [Thermoanaerobaculia bacterium]|nr:toll/interleukin-1 receptor domain-containing protein [Thermoanaerobaculia bacterium]
MSTPAKVLFLSYSHDSRAHSERVLALAERLRKSGFDARLDQYVNGAPENGWARWMKEQLEAADRVLLVCTETYYRRFWGQEEPGKGKGADWEGAIVTHELYQARSSTKKFIPVLFAATDQQFVPEPLGSHTHYVLTSEQIYQDLCDALLEQAGVEPGPIGPLPIRPRRKAEPLTFPGAPSGASKVAPTNLGHVAPELFGREADLAKLDAAWAEGRLKVVTLVAMGGAGKTSLVAKWAAGLDLGGADYFDWSFYSQGTRQEGEGGSASGEPFVAAALRFFGEEEGARLADSSRHGGEKGAKLAEFVARRKALLILDGLEPLQYPPTSPLAGQLKDPGVEALLKGLARSNPGLCLVTTREEIAEHLNAFLGKSVEQWEVDRLSEAAGVALLRKLGVEGNSKEMAKAVEEVDGHALTLDLLGTYLVKARLVDIRQRDRVRFEKADKRVKGGHAFRVIGAYETWLGGGGEESARQLAVLRLMGLFDRPASAGCIDALRAEPSIPGLTEPLVGLDEDDWNLTISALADLRLLSPASSTLDAHPLIREYFGKRVKERSPEAWKEAHDRLFEYLRDNTEKWPDSLEGLQPLYQAVAHGCQAGRQQEACDRVYFDRILRGSGPDGFYSTKKLGAFGADLGAVACFFDLPWSRVSTALSEADQAWMLNQVAFHLRGLGRLTEALEPMRVTLAINEMSGEWSKAAVVASNLSQLELTLGDVPAALQDGEASVSFADRSEDEVQRMGKRTTHADALHQAGRREEALALFREAERIQAEWQPDYPRLYSLQGFRFCDMLLAEAERAAGRRERVGEELSGGKKALREVEERGRMMFEWRLPSDSTLDIALEHLILGRAALYRGILESTDLAPARTEIERAVDGLRRAGQSDQLPKGLLTRSWLRFLEGNPLAARADLDEAQEITERGPMPLYLADIALYRGRLFGDRAALAEARRLIEKHGYGRRLEELADAEAALGVGSV